ncbi:MAG: hypothetical protein OHK0039_43420 [Bacteroidia bacterium]
MQTILGATGIIGTELAKALPAFTTDIRLVSRNPRPVNPTDTLLAADLTDAAQTLRAVEGSDTVYLTAGLPYSTKVWREVWPVLMRNVVTACKTVGARLVFFSNVYPYGRVDGPMTEDTPVQPASQKGHARARVEEMIMEAVGRGELEAMIVRAADFYGPATPLSFVNVMLFENLAKGKKGQWLVGDQFLHSFSYTPDAGRATAVLGNTPSAYN